MTSTLPIKPKLISTLVKSLPEALAPFKPGAFPNNPKFHNCTKASFFNRYDQTYLNSGRHNCQDKIFYREQSYDIWAQNLVTLGSIEIVSPLNGVPTLGKLNRNGFTSSIPAWLGDSLRPIKPSYHGVLPNEVDIESVCDKVYAQAMSDWRSAVDTYCGNATWHNGAAAGVLGSFVSQCINETCQTDKKTGNNCNDVIYNFTVSETVDKMPTNELCSDCYISRLKMMQSTPFSYYNRDSFYEDALKKADSLFPSKAPEPAFCLSDVTYTTKAGDTCDSLALKFSVSSIAIFIGNPDILDYNDMVYELCGNLQSATIALGRVICITPPSGKYKHDVNTTNSDPAYSGLPLFIQANPSVSEGSCTADLIPGRTYCIGPSKEAFTQRLKPVPPHTRFRCFAREADTTNRSVLTLADAQHVKPMSIVACQS
ncbi:hypothetical protein LZL87_013057 [Fusarium oxysporum]|nr:hypothetical protein LZL87_013057 [Fusarium oxysporum]